MGGNELLRSQIVTLELADEFNYSRSQNATIKRRFQKETLTFSKSGIVSCRHRMKLRSSLLRNEEKEAELSGVDES
jgi:hypothetical protein